MSEVNSRTILIRPICFAALWVIALAVRDAPSGDPEWKQKVAWMAVFAVPAVLMLWLAQRLAHRRIHWMVELFGMPFIIGGLVYAAVAIRDIL